MPRRCCSWRSSTCISSRSILSSAPKRLVEQQHRRLDDHGACQRDTLLLPARELTRIAIGERTELHELECLGDRGGTLAARHAAHAQAERDVLRHVQVREQARSSGTPCWKSRR